MSLADQSLRDAMLTLVQEIQQQLPPSEPQDNIPSEVMVDILAILRTIAMGLEVLLDPFAQLDLPAEVWLSNQFNAQIRRVENARVYQIPDYEELETG